MKTLYIIGGTMGVGKTAACVRLNEKLDSCVFLDGDWCWNMNPFVVSGETKQMVVDNICHLLNSFLACTQLENIVFCWVMHEQAIIDDIVSRLRCNNCRVICVSLVCNESALRARLGGDILKGVREPDVLERSLARIPLYDRLNTVKIDVSDLSVEQTADAIAALK